MNYSFLTYQDFTLPYLTFGKGPELLIAFHGFGRSAVDFKVLEQSLGAKYTIVAFDLFYHGEHAISFDTTLPTCEPAAMARLMERYLWEHKRVNFSLMGYSLGGKIALGIVQKMAHRVNEVFLLAPDGLKKNSLYTFACNTLLGNYLMARIIHKPKTALKINDWLLRLKIIHPKVHEFYAMKLSDETMLKKLYQTGLIFRYFHPSLVTIAKQINSRKIRLKMFFGKNDFIIRTSLGIKFQKKLRKQDTMVILDCGHRVLNKADEIANIVLATQIIDHR